MQTSTPSEFKTGMVLMLEDAPYLIEELHTTGTAKTKHKLHARLRNLHTGRVADRAFQDTDHIGVTELEHRMVQFSYKQGEDFVFMDNASFEEFTLSLLQVGERHWFLKENFEYKALFIEGKFLDIQLPDHIALKVVQTAAPQRAAQSSADKTALLEGDMEIMVPLFIAVGDLVRVDTRTRKYLGKEGG